MEVPTPRPWHRGADLVAGWQELEELRQIIPSADEYPLRLNHHVQTQAWRLVFHLLSLTSPESQVVSEGATLCLISCLLSLEIRYIARLSAMLS